MRGPDLNRRPSGYEPDELPSCSTPRPYFIVKHNESYTIHLERKWSDTRGSNS
ncbi:hypothetical protein IFVP5_C1450001 [Vibrio parahaemolyticus]